MLKRTLSSFAVAFFVAATAGAQSKGEDIVISNPKLAAKQEAGFLSNPRQLTFEGRRAGEGYFNKDGTQLVFQSERVPGNPFFQIYLMDLDTGDVDRVSPGHGKTTCAWIHPSAAEVLFASTHDDPAARAKQRAELKLRSEGKQRRYSWDYDEHFEIYSYNRKTKKYVNLTNKQGYDAEGSWSPNGKWIAFASNRRAYDRPMTEKQQAMFKIDPAYMMDIYIMKADGSNVTRLTESPGYDGGPFFSPDGKRICWRRFAPNGATAEIMTMNIDGSDKRQLTDLGRMSWAPYYHPSGDYLIFTTNRHGFGNFELYLVDAEGKSKPVRVTHTKGFDGLPVFTPNGRQLAWTTNRTAAKRSQIFMAGWNDKLARKLLKLEDVAATAIARNEASKSVRNTSTDFSPEDALRHVNYLCHPNLGGRLTGTPGEKLATAYVAAYLDGLGLLPAGEKGKWFQNFEFTAGVALGKRNVLLTGDRPLELNKAWRPVAFSKTGKVAASEVVFAGYGIVAPKLDEQAEYDSYVHLDVKNKWVVALRYLPEGITPERRQHLSRYSSLRYKAMQARDHGAKGLIIVSGPNSKVRQQLVRLRFDGSMTGASLPVISVSDKVVEAWLAANGKSLRGLQTKLDTGGLMGGFLLKKVKLSADIDIERVRKTGRNVLGRLAAGDKPTAEVIIVGAHIDHLGKGASGSSLARDGERNGIHFGADDNASGVAAMLEIAEYLSDLKKRGRLKLRRDIIFAAWSGEELGLIGSSHFVRVFAEKMAAKSAHGHGNGHTLHPGSPHAAGGKKAVALKKTVRTQPAKDSLRKSSVKKHSVKKGRGVATPTAKQGVKKHAAKKHIVQKHGQAKAKHGQPLQQDPHAQDPHGHGQAKHQHNSIHPAIAACINMDMVGRMGKKVVLQGVGSSSIWRGEIERRNAPVGLPLTLQNDSYLPTDASSFYMRGVPILSAFTGSHRDYHTPRDTPDKLNYEGLVRIAHFMGLVTRSLAIREKAPDYVAQAAPQRGARSGLKIYLGTIPDYSEAETKGVPLSGVGKGGPAAKAGLRAGDIIINLAGKKIDNIYDYTFAIDALKIGQKVKVTVIRDGKKFQSTIIPGSRE